MTRAITFEDAKRVYVNRYTLEHVPAHIRLGSQCGNGLYQAPQYRNDAEWYAATTFPGEGLLSARSQHCESRGQTWPLGKWLREPLLASHPIIATSTAPQALALMRAAYTAKPVLLMRWSADGVHGGEVAAMRSPGHHAGVWWNVTGGSPLDPENGVWTVDLAALRAALPYRLRKAFDRSGTVWWSASAAMDGSRAYDDLGNRAVGYITLRGSRGQHLTTIYLNPYVYDPAADVIETATSREQAK